MPSQVNWGPGVDITPPSPGVDYGLRVHADLGSGVIQVQTQTQGAANWATTQLTSSASAQQIFAARATRRSAVVTNTDTTNPIYVGTAILTTANGEYIGPGQSLTIPTTAAIFVIAGGGTPRVTGAEAYD